MLADMNAYARSPLPLRPDHTAIERERRRSFVRGITCLALNSGRPDGAADLLRRTWNNDLQAAEWVKAATSPSSTANFPAVTKTSVLQSLAPASASAQLFARCLQLSLAGISEIRIPHIATAPQPGFVPEGSAAPLAQFSLAGVDLGPVRRILILASVSGELEAERRERIGRHRKSLG